MGGVTRAVRLRRKSSERHYEKATRTALAISGALTSVLGFVLAAGGYLSANGSAFHMVVGLILIFTGALVAKRNRAGAWTYLTVFVATLTWSLRNIEDGTSLAFRLIGPAIILAIIAVLMPILCQWRPRRAAIGFGGLAFVTIGIGVSSAANGPLAGPTAALNHFLDAETKGVLQ